MYRTHPLFAACHLATCIALGQISVLSAAPQSPSAGLPVVVGEFAQPEHLPYTISSGLPSDDVSAVARNARGAILAQTTKGVAVFSDGDWKRWTSQDEPGVFTKTEWFPTLAPEVPDVASIRAVARHGSEIAVAAAQGLYLGDGNTWKLALPRQGTVRWAPIDVRAVAYDARGQLWFACPQGVGYRIAKDKWRLFTGADGLPFNDFTCMAIRGQDVWLGTSNGAIRYADGIWEFRQGRRWLLDNYVRAVAITDDGSAWFATSAGVSCIRTRKMTLPQKAAFFEAEIDKHHRRTPLGYVNAANLSSPGEKSTAAPKASDNDGHFTGLYCGAVSLGYAATKTPKLKADAQKAFAAVAFLSEVTQGGSHPAPPGFIARAIAPTDEPNPNLQFTPEKDGKRRDAQDALWKIMSPRWPIDKSGKWYWKCDSSSDELDGHYFALGVYYDRACETDAEKDEVKKVVRRLTDHLIDHNFTMIDYDGLPTRWGHFSPDDLNRNLEWWFERGLNSASILTYLLVAHHITGDQKYRDIYRKLAIDEGYAMNVMAQPKINSGPGSYGQADDNMSFMNYYHLLRYETDPKLLNMYRNGIYYHWRIEKYERNPFLNFVYAACCLGKTRQDAWGVMELNPDPCWIEDSVDSLTRYPLDLVDWPMSNAHRTDMRPLHEYTRDPGGHHQGLGGHIDGKVFRIDEQHALYWGDDPWQLTSRADGTRLREGVSFLLAYYLGRFHGFIAD